MTDLLTRPLDWPEGEVIGDYDGDTMWIPTAIAPTLRDAVRYVMLAKWAHEWTRRDLIEAHDRVHLRRMAGPEDREDTLASIGVDIDTEPYWEQCDASHPDAFPAWRFG